MKSARPKVLHGILGRPVLGHVLAAARTLSPHPLVVVVGHGGEEVRKAFAAERIAWVEQKERLGTGHALLQAEPALKGFAGRLVVLCGDAPLVTPETLQGLMRAAEGRVGTVLTCEVEDPAGYGRVMRDPRGDVTRIVEHRDATEAERLVRRSTRRVRVQAAVFDAVRQTARTTRRASTTSPTCCRS